MGFYSQVIFPRLCEFFLNRPAVAGLRRQMLAAAAGQVLEIGFGTGLNLPHYPEHVQKITTVDPHRGMHRLAQQRIAQAGIQVEQRILSGEQLPFDDCSFDCAVSAFTLCSIENVSRALGELHRVLRPGGRFLFLEHGVSPEPRVRKWQRRLNWLEMRLGGGCRLDRDIRGLVASVPFAEIEIDEFYLERVPRTHGYIYLGAAVKA
jgi:ubiquinone/menaquinone biosynthesis C-methylase UbiE